MLRKKVLSIILFFCVITTVTAKCDVAEVCVTDLQQSDCDPQILVSNSHIFGCCPSCQTPSGMLIFCMEKSNGDFVQNTYK